jgi:hypothetical protein
MRSMFIRLHRMLVPVRLRGDSGMTTAEYAVGTVAATAFAVILYKIVTGGQVTTLLTSIVKRALSVLS